MYRYNYPIWHELLRGLRRVASLILGLILFFVTVELVVAENFLPEEVFGRRGIFAIFAG